VKYLYPFFLMGNWGGWDKYGKTMQESVKCVRNMKQITVEFEN
jgi:hypothetical protein